MSGKKSKHSPVSTEREVPVLTPVHSGIARSVCHLTIVLTPEMQEQFRGFSFVADPDSI